MTAGFYVQNGIVVEAEQLIWEAVPGIVMTQDGVHTISRAFGYFDEIGRVNIDIMTANDMVTAYPGDWIIRGAEGIYCVCRADVFSEAYEPVQGDYVSHAGKSVNLYEDKDAA